jgi:hypothetical protein
MKSKQQKYEEAIARNADNRGKYLHEATELGLQGDKREAFADHKQGVRRVKEHKRTVVNLDE